MTRWIALLRAVNVGGTGKLKMADLRAKLEDVGLSRVETYLASGNAIFDGPDAEYEARDKVALALSDLGKEHHSVLLRDAASLELVLEHIPFPTAEPSRIGIVFLHKMATDADLATKKKSDEAIINLGREIAIHFPNGMGQSKLSIAAFDTGTMRNLNTVTALAERARR